VQLRHDRYLHVSGRDLRVPDRRRRECLGVHHLSGVRTGERQQLHAGVRPERRRHQLSVWERFLRLFQRRLDLQMRRVPMIADGMTVTTKERARRLGLAYVAVAVLLGACSSGGAAGDGGATGTGGTGSPRGSMRSAGAYLRTS
jgi:hypothetical protein